MSRIVYWLLIALAGAVGLGGICAPARSQPTISVGAITSQRDCRLYETFWGGWLILECRNNFAALRARLQSALAESGRFRLATGGGRYVLTGAITELGVQSGSAGGRDYQVNTSRAVASFDYRLRDTTTGALVRAGTITESVDAAFSMSATGYAGGDAASPRAIYASLQRAVAIATARDAAQQVDPLRVTAVSGRQIRVNYGAPLLSVDDSIQVTNAMGFPVRYRVTQVMPDGAIADAAGDAGGVAVGASASLAAGGGPASGMNRYARVDLPTGEDMALGGVQTPPPAALIERPAVQPTPSAHPPAAAPARQGRTRQQTAERAPRLTAQRGETPPTAPSATGVTRIALVVGVGGYRTMGTLPNLANPVNDARLVAESLRAVGFDVDLVLDPDQRTMRAAISRLGQRMAEAGRGSTGLFYFAGHGVQARGVNYLIPAQAPINREADLELEAISAQAVLRQLEEASDTTNIVILDACRNLPSTLTRGFRSASAGLSQMRAPRGSFIAYSTAPDDVAADGQGSNSPFASALAREIQRPGQPIEQVFRNVRISVLDDTNNEQHRGRIAR